jgi:pyridoxamine 5'-phosphate oxidase
VNTRSHEARAARADDKADLATILDDVWRHLYAGANAGRERSPYTIMQLATIGRDGFPKLRTVVLREAGRERSALRFHTDVRSEKAREMACNGQVALLSSDVQAGIQIRMEGLARLVEEEDERLRVWNSSRPGTLILYRAPLTPGSPIGAPHDAKPRSQPEQAHPHAGFEHFALVEVTVSKIDFLDVSTDVHRRARFTADDAGWHSQWIAP